MSYTKIYDFPVTEPSGVIASRNHPGWYYMHRDGNRPFLYAFKIVNGAIVNLGGGVYYRTLTLRQSGINLSMTDFEDITITEDGTIVIADIGDNAHNRNGTSRPRPFVCKFSEPANPDSNQNIEVGPKYNLKWNDSDTTANRHHPDCESIFFWNGSLYLISKEGTFLNNEGNRDPQIVKLPNTLSSGSVNNLTYVASLTRVGGVAKTIHKPMWADMEQTGDRLAIGITGSSVSGPDEGHHLVVYSIDPADNALTGDARLAALVSNPPAFTKNWNSANSFDSIEGGCYVNDGSRDLVLVDDNGTDLFYWPAAFYGDTAQPGGGGEPPTGGGGCILGCATQAGDTVRLEAVETQMGRNYGVFSTYLTNAAMTSAEIQYHIDAGRILYMKRNRTGTYNWIESANGADDAMWDADANAVKAKATELRAAGLQVWIGTNHEVSGSGYADKAGGETNKQIAGGYYINHFENMVSRYNAILGADIDLVKFIVSTTSYQIAHPDNTFGYFIPPSADYVGYTNYNDGNINTWRDAYNTAYGYHSSPSGATPSYDRLAAIAPGKPIVIVESSCQESKSTNQQGGHDPTAKREWFLDLIDGLKALPNIIAYIVWDSNAGVGGTPSPDKVWPVDSVLDPVNDNISYDFAGTTFQDGFKIFANDPYMSGVTVTPPTPPSGVVRQRLRDNGSGSYRIRVGDSSGTLFV